jgi:glycosyltransferase involved in cell wall biosynthesis
MSRNVPADQVRGPVDFVVRSDLYTKPGGDTVQIDAYVRCLRTRGLVVDVTPFHPRMPAPRPGSVVHLVNVDQPYELLEAARRAADHKVVISTIHHSRQQLRRMRAAEPDPRRRLLSLSPEQVRAFLVYSASLGRRDDAGPTAKLSAILRALRLLPRLWETVGGVLDSADAVLVLGERERRSLVEDFGVTGDNVRLTPNGRPPIATDGPREQRTIVVGRIEARKRQLETLRVAEDLGVALTFVGAGNPGQRRYTAAFAAEVRASRFSTWLDALPWEEVQRLMRTSTVLLNCSWVEVQSLVDLEAAASGCRVVSTYDAGSSHDWLGPRVVEVACDDLSAAVTTAESLRTRRDPPPPITYPHTWETTSEIILDVYRSMRLTA